MSIVKSSSSNLTLNADGANNDIKFQSNGSEVASIDQAGLVTANAVGIGGTNDSGKKLHIEGNGTDVGITLKDTAGVQYEIKSDANNFTIRNSSASADRLTITSNGKVGIGTTTPQTEMHVVTATTSLVHIGGTANANGNYQGISLGYSEAGNTAYRKVAVVSAGIGDGSARQTFHVLVDTASDSGSTQLVDSKFSVSGTTGICQARNGLTFGSDTASANALDDYEEGTWTPVLTDLSNNATMHALTAGVYTKIGRLVTVTANVRTSSLGSVSGNLYVTGFPYTSANTNGNNGAGAVANAENMNITAGHAITLYVGKNDPKGRFDIYDHAGGITALQSGEWSSDGMAAITATYST